MQGYINNPYFSRSFPLSCMLLSLSKYSVISSRLLFSVHVLASLLSVSHYSLRFSAGTFFLLTSSFIHLQLFFTHTTGHTHPISQKTSEPKVHEVSRNPRIVRCIEPSSHFCYLSCFVFLVVDGSAVESLSPSCPVCRYAIASFRIPYVAILSRPPIHTDSSFYTVPSFPEVF